MYLQYVTCTSRAVLQLCGYDNANEFHLVFPLLEPQTGSTVGDWRGWRDFDFVVMGRRTKTATVNLSDR